MFNSLQAQRYPAFKLAILVLLTLNFIIYAVFDTWVKAVDALVWLGLLILYEMEANGIALERQALLHRIRTGLIMIVPLIFLAYLDGKEWLDVVNSLFWFALIALLESEVRWPEKVIEHSHAYWLATVIVFTGLLALVFAWLWKKAWLDAYDAGLWLAAFATIEVDIFDLFKKKSAG